MRIEMVTIKEQMNRAERIAHTDAQLVMNEKLRAEVDRLKAENARLQSSLSDSVAREWPGKGLKELLEPTIDTLQRITDLSQETCATFEEQSFVAFAMASKELARLRGLVPEANKTTPLTSS